MKGRIFIVGFVVALSAGAFLAVLLSRGELISTRIWFVGSVVGFIGLIVVDLVGSLSLEPARSQPVWHRPAERAGSFDRSHRSAEVLIGNATRDHRVFESRLRPRLATLATHFVPLRAGIDVDRNPDAVARLLGDVSWLVDEQVRHRTPTPAEIQRFLTILDADGPTTDRSADPQR